MKSKFKIFSVIILFFVFSLINLNRLIAQDIVIDAKEVDIKNKGNLITATGLVKITDGENIEISGEKAKYNKLDQNLEIEGNVIFYDKSRSFKALSDKVIFDRNKKVISSFKNTSILILNQTTGKPIYNIKGENSFIDQNKKILEIVNNVSLVNILENYEIKTEKIIYNKTDETFKSFNETNIDYKNKIKIISSDILYDINEKIFTSYKKSILIDELGNNFELSSFNFDLVNNIFKSKKLKVTDLENNSIKALDGMVNLNNNEIVATNFKLNFRKDTFGNSENDPRLIGNYILTNKSETKMKKAIFTTCKEKKGKCPAWSISAEEANHLKDIKIIEYKNAWLEIYNTPVAYFPYFFHPDPTVKRQSGFLFPQFINSSNLGFSTEIPYYKVIDLDKDFTISPRVYTNNNLFVQTEYRQVFKNSNLVTDLSINKKGDYNNHFFTNLKGNFENSFYEMKIETTSNNNYLKKYQIKSPIINSYSTLNSSFLIEKVSDNSAFSSSIEIIEDLGKEKNDKYSYIFPNYQYTNEIFLNKFFDKINYTSIGKYNKFDTNIDEANIINDFLFETNKLSIFNNTENDIKFLIRNINTYGDLSSHYKEGTNYNLLSSFLYNVKYPMYKDTESGKKFLTPIASLRFSPNNGLNLKNEKILTSFEDLFTLDRISGQTVESGGSVTLGVEYKSLNKVNEDKINLGLGINLRNEEEDDLPLSTSLNQKTSDIIGYSGINITENLSFNYNFSIDNDLSGTNYSLAALNYNSNIFKTSFEYMEKSNLIGDESYLINTTELEINKFNSIAFKTNKNLDKNLTDYYNLIYSYKNDCLQASLVYNKQFYKDDTISSDKNLMFKISFIPFGSINSPSLND